MSESKNVTVKAAQIINKICANTRGSTAWRSAQDYLLSHQSYKNDFMLHLAIYQKLYPDWQTDAAPAWFPSAARVATANITAWMKTFNFPNYHALHHWSYQHYADFWEKVINQLRIRFHTSFTSIAATTTDIENIEWLPGAKMNIADSCFNTDADEPAIIYQTIDGIKKMTYQALNQLSNRVANSLVQHGCRPGTTIAIDMLMNAEAVAIYLGIIKAGCCVVSIADCFAAAEVQVRLNIADVKMIFVNDIILRNGKTHPLYEKIISPDLPHAIVIPIQETLKITLRAGDLNWHDFLSNDVNFASIACAPGDYTNILFSSGTTGTPKAIPWTHTTPIKCASDAFFHQDIQAKDVLCWPTNLGWMMGPWLIYAALLNRATIALYNDSPNTAQFGKFVAATNVTMLGIVPSMVKNWRVSQCMHEIDWQQIKTFSSSAECSNPEDMLYLMFLANYKPIIEYCGGTEIGGGYISSTVIEANVPSLLTTPTMGLNFEITDQKGQLTDDGEVVIMPPSIGLSTTLLNRDHHAEYFSKVKGWQENLILRRHGDKIKRISKYYYRLEGRTDDTMNLGGIKTSAAEIERTLNCVSNIQETAAIAIANKTGGPEQLIIYAVLQDNLTNDLAMLKNSLQQAIKNNLNPLFKIAELIIIPALPKTASNKIMRKELRKHYRGSLT